MNIVVTSDLHGRLPEIPECDLLIVAGDVCPYWDHRLAYQAYWLEKAFYKWLSHVPARKIVGCWGNHDLIAQEAPHRLPDCLPHKITMLTDELIEWEGLRIYGMPWQLRFYDWAFNLDEDELDEKYAAIPPCDVLATHGPPKHHCDSVGGGPPLGSSFLTSRIIELSPMLVATGHIHDGYGYDWLDPTLIVNGSHMNERYEPANPPIMVRSRPVVEQALWLDQTTSLSGLDPRVEYSLAC